METLTNIIKIIEELDKQQISILYIQCMKTIIIYNAAEKKKEMGIIKLLYSSQLGKKKVS